MKKTRQNLETANIAVNAVTFTLKDHQLVVALSPRDKEPFKNMMELPGGLLLDRETAENTLHRKLQEITGVKDSYYQQFFTFTDPDRDPRARIISVGFVALIPSEKISNLKNYYPVDNLPKLAFDHRKIVLKAISYLRQNLSYELVGHLLPTCFPLNDLQTAYEVVGGQLVDNRNFRKQVINSGRVVKAAITQQNVHHRPAILYHFA